MSCDCHVTCKRNKCFHCSFTKYPWSNCFCETKSTCFHEAYFLFYNFNFCNFRVNGNAPRVFIHNPLFVKLVPFYSEGQCRKIWSTQHSGISAGFFFSFSNRVCIALLPPERFQITNDTACIRSSDERPPLSAAHLDAQVPSKAEEVIWDWASQKTPTRPDGVYKAWRKAPPDVERWSPIRRHGSGKAGGTGNAKCISGFFMGALGAVEGNAGGPTHAAGGELLPRFTLWWAYPWKRGTSVTVLREAWKTPPSL